MSKTQPRLTLSPADREGIEQGGGGQPVVLALRAPEAACALGISQRLLWSLTNQGLIPHVKLGRATLYPVDQLREFLAGRAKGGRS